MAVEGPMRRLLLLALLSLPAFAQYTSSAGKSAPTTDVERVTRGTDGQEKREIIHVPVQKDGFGNAAGSQHDLAVDGAFDGQTVVVMHLYTGGGFDFALPKKALAEKGFAVYRWIDRAPSPAELEKALSRANQLWIISGDQPQLTAEHVKVIKKFFDEGHGLYLWGDNAPYAQDADRVARALFDVELKGDPYDKGEQVVGRQAKPGKTGLLPDHLLTTGIEQLYEGHSIAFMPKPGPLKPLIVGTEGHVVAAYFDQGGKRAIVDGGFTRLYINWDTAGTGRYVKNSAAWLANAERFGSAVVAKGLGEKR
jgi:hypothetical protein